MLKNDRNPYMIGYTPLSPSRPPPRIFYKLLEIFYKISAWSGSNECRGILRGLKTLTLEYSLSGGIES